MSDENMSNSNMPNNGAPNVSAPDYQPLPNSAAPEPKKKKWPIAVGIIAAVAIAGGASAAYWFYFRTPSFQSPTEAITSCMSQLDTQFSTKELGSSTLEERLDSEALMKAMQEKGQQMQLTMSLEDSDIAELSMLEGTTIGFDYQADAKNNSLYGGLNMSVMGIGADLGFYFDKDKFALVSDEFLPDAYLAVNKSDIEDMLEEEMLTKEQIEYIMSSMEQQSAEMYSALQDFSEYSAKQLPDSLVSFAKSWDIDETDEDGKTSSVKIGGKDYDCYSYDVTISSKDFQEFLEDYCTYLSKYDFENNAYFSALDKAYQYGGVYGAGSFSENISDALKELPKQIDGSEKETLDLTMHVSPKGQLLGIEIAYDEDDNQMDLELLFGGDKPGQEIYMNLELEDSYQTLTWNLSSTRTIEKKKETIAFNCDFDMDGDILKLDSKTVFDTSSKDELPCTIDLNFDMDIDGEQISAGMDAEAVYSNIKKGQGYDCEISSWNISVDSEEFSQSLELSCELSAGVLEDSVKKLPKTGYNVLDLSDKDVEEIADTVSKSKLISYVIGSSSKDQIVKIIKELRDEMDLDNLDLDEFF